MATLLTAQNSFSSRSSIRLEPTADLEDYERAYMNDCDDGEGGGIMTSLGSFGEEETYEPPIRKQVKRNVSFEMKHAVQSLEYTAEDLEILACNSAQFEVLKQSLRKKGAITNEVLKQKLPLFLKYKKDRMKAKNPPEPPRRTPLRTRSASSATSALAQMSTAERNSNLKPANRVLTEEELEADQPQQTMIGRILRPNAKRNTPLRSFSSNSASVSDAQRNAAPLRTKSTGRNVPSRTTSLSRMLRRAPSTVGEE